MKKKNPCCTHNSQEALIRGKMVGGGVIYNYTANARRIDGIVDIDVPNMEKTFFLLNGFLPGYIEYDAYCPQCETERVDQHEIPGQTQPEYIAV